MNHLPYNVGRVILVKRLILLVKVRLSWGVSQASQGGLSISSLVVDFVNPLQVVTTYAHVEHMV